MGTLALRVMSGQCRELMQPFPPGAEGFTTQEDQEMLSRIEKQLKRRFAIGSQVSEHSIVQDFMRQVRQGPYRGLGCETRHPRLLLRGQSHSPRGGKTAFWLYSLLKLFVGSVAGCDCRV